MQIIRRREVVVEPDGVRHVADAALDRERIARRIVTEHPRLPTADVAQAQQHQDGRRLAGAVRAEQPEDFAFADAERHAIDGNRRPIAFGEALGLDDRLTHRRPKRATAPTRIRSAAPMMPTPAMPHMVEVVTVTRKLALPVSPREEALMVLT